MPAVNAHVDRASLERVQAQLRQLDRSASSALRVTSTSIAGDVADGINRGFLMAGAPQAHRFASSARPKPDRIPTVRVGGRKREGGFVNGMAVLNAVNYGSRLKRFHTAPNSSGTVVEPAVRRLTPAAFKKWSATVDRLVHAFNRGGGTSG